MYYVIHTKAERLRSLPSQTPHMPRNGTYVWELEPYIRIQNEQVEQEIQIKIHHQSEKYRNNHVEQRTKPIQAEL